MTYVQTAPAYVPSSTVYVIPDTQTYQYYNNYYHRTTVIIILRRLVLSVGVIFLWLRRRLSRRILPRRLGWWLSGGWHGVAAGIADSSTNFVLFTPAGFA